MDMAKPGPAPSITPEDVLDVFAARDDPTEPLTTPEIADTLGCSRSTALGKLRELDERGDVRSKKSALARECGGFRPLRTSAMCSQASARGRAPDSRPPSRKRTSS